MKPSFSKLFAGLVFTLYSLDPNEAAVQALNLFKTRARLCETSDPSKQTDEAMEVRSGKFNILEHFKETIRVISRGTMPDLQRYPLRSCLIKYELDSNVFVSSKCLF